jgi:hypothetical protein
MLAAMHGKISCVEKLLEAGANVCKVSNFGIFRFFLYLLELKIRKLMWVIVFSDIDV